MSPAEVTEALDRLTERSSRGRYATRTTWPRRAGPMTWSINGDRFGGWEFQRTFDGYFG
ncbi:hypothetical protein ACFV2D_29060 [Streptomyces capillispiralis]|uniref:hypothetical protein n=1 Tax=Streptomyces capillispiralis TaxID=68182 RepID=UPI0036C0B7E8